MILATAAQILGSNPKMEAGDPRIVMSRLLFAQMSGGFGLVLNLSERMAGGSMGTEIVLPGRGYQSSRRWARYKVDVPVTITLRRLGKVTVVEGRGSELAAAIAPGA